MLQTAPMPKLIGHRGMKSLAPENTAASIRAAAGHGVTWVELDVTLAGDGSLVMWHDADLTKICGQPVRLSELNHTQIKAMDAGSWFSHHFAGEPLLLLGEALALVTDLRLGLNLEIKINPDLPASQLTQAVCKEPLLTGLINQRRLLISSFHHPSLAQVANALPRCPLGALYEHLPEDGLSQLGFKASTIHSDADQLQPERLAKIKDQYPVYVYTVNTKERYNQLLAMGVIGVFSDCPHLLA